MTLDTQTISALAAAAAAAAAATVALIQFYVGYRQSKAALIAAEASRKGAESVGRRRIAEFRQTWIDNVRDTLSEYQSLLVLAALPRKSPGVDSLSWEDNVRFYSLRAKLEMLLNPTEEATSDLFVAIDDAMQVQGIFAKIAKSAAINAAAHRILKTEWRRLQYELLQ